MNQVMRLLLTGWTLALLCLRPSIFGEKYNALVFVIFFFITCLLVGLQKNSFILSRKRLGALIVIYLCLLYFLIQGLILSEAREIVVNASVFLLLTAPCIALIINRYQETILKIFINFHYYLSISAVVTFAIFLINGLSIYKLPYIASLYELVGYAAFDPIRPLSNHVLVFPFSVIWSTADLFGISFPRFVGIYREPGMSQIFFITALTLTYFVPVRHLQRKRLFILAGCLLLISAAGAINLVLVAMVYAATNTSLKQHLITFIKNPIIIFIFIIALIGLGRAAFQMTAKKIGEVSGQTRIESFENGLSRLSENPWFGKGYYSAFQQDNRGSIVLENNIGLIGVSFQIGIIGLTLYFFCWAFSLSQLAAQRTFVIYLPCLLTLLFSQPSYNDAFVWFLLLLDTRDFVKS